MFGSRFPHAFVQINGTLDADHRPVHQNFGYTVVKLTTAVLHSNVPGTVEAVEESYVSQTNLHFAVPLTDDQYRAVLAEVAKWRDAPGAAYNLDNHNCEFFVAALAQLVGLRADVPKSMIHTPKAWLNYVGDINPQLHAAHVK